MSAKRILPILLLAAVLTVSLGFAGNVHAYACGTTYTVRSGDSLGGIAKACGTSVAALRLANPGLDYYIYPGQVLVLPGAYWDNGNGYATYVVARGDTLKALASRFGTTMDALASLNAIYNYNLIFEGQRLTVPSAGTNPPPHSPPPSSPPPTSGTRYTVQRGDTLRKIADRIGVSVNDILAVNPQIVNPNLIYVGQVINLPAAASYYTVQWGDTMKKIATRFGTTLDALIALNPQIWNINLIYPGQVIRIR
jgi:LysM repeat protein